MVTEVEVERLKEVGQKKIKNRAKQTEKNKLIHLEEEIISYDDKIKRFKVSIPKLTDYLLNKYVFKTIYGRNIEEIYVYDRGIYILKGKEIIETEAEKLLGNHSSNHIINEVVEKIKRTTSISKEVFENIPTDTICLENGIFDTKSWKLIEHNPNYYFKTKIPVFYKEESKCENFIKFIEEVLYPEYIPVIQELFGFCLYRKYFIKKGMIWVGEPDTSKTTLINILIVFLGEVNKSGISLQRITHNDKFGLSSLYNKYLNVYDDLSSKDLEDIGGFKIATGGGYITAEYKFGEPFQFMSFAKQLFATNKIPPPKEEVPLGYYERWIVIPFGNVITEEEKDSFIIDKLTTKEELSGILNWALIGLGRLLQNQKFSYNKTVEEVKKIMTMSGNPLIRFVEDVLLENPKNKISKEQMFEIYCAYVKEKGLPRLSKEQLGRQLYKVAPFIIPKRDSERYWDNVSLKVNPCVSKDTIDTILNIMSNKLGNSNNAIYDINKEVSKVSDVLSDIDKELGGLFDG